MALSDTILLRNLCNQLIPKGLRIFHRSDFPWAACNPLSCKDLKIQKPQKRARRPHQKSLDFVLSCCFSDTIMLVLHRNILLRHGLQLHDRSKIYGRFLILFPVRVYRPKYPNCLAQYPLYSTELSRSCCVFDTIVLDFLHFLVEVEMFIRLWRTEADCLLPSA
jgi:hypothetical protein